MGRIQSVENTKPAFPHSTSVLSAHSGQILILRDSNYAKRQSIPDHESLKRDLFATLHAQKVPTYTKHQW